MMHVLHCVCGVPSHGPPAGTQADEDVFVDAPDTAFHAADAPLAIPVQRVCKHGLPPAPFTVKNPDSCNYGRQFLRCPRPRSLRCNYFEWMDASDGTAPRCSVPVPIELAASDMAAAASWADAEAAAAEHDAPGRGYMADVRDGVQSVSTCPTHDNDVFFDATDDVRVPYRRQCACGDADFADCHCGVHCGDRCSCDECMSVPATQPKSQFKQLRRILRGKSKLDASYSPPQMHPVHDVPATTTCTEHVCSSVRRLVRVPAIAAIR